MTNFHTYSTHVSKREKAKKKKEGILNFEVKRNELLACRKFASVLNNVQVSGNTSS